MRKGILFILTFALIYSISCGSSIEKQDVDEIKTIIAQKWENYIDAAKMKDADRLVSIWNQDMRLLSDPGGLEDIRSIEKHRKLAESGLKSFSVASLEVNANEVTLINDNIAIEIGK